MNVTPEDGIAVTESVVIVEVDAAPLPIGARWDADAQAWVTPAPEQAPEVINEPEVSAEHEAAPSGE